MIYIAGPYRAPSAWGVENNIRIAEYAGKVLAEHGQFFICPHTMCRFYNGTVTEQFWCDFTLELLKLCDEIVLVGDWEKSKQTQVEYNYAWEHQYKIMTWEEKLNELAITA